MADYVIRGRGMGKTAVAQQPVSVQRWEDEAETLKKIKELEDAPASPDEGRRKKAMKLLGKAQTDAERKKANELKAKFSKGFKTPATASPPSSSSSSSSQSSSPLPSPAAVKTPAPTKTWLWSDSDKHVAELLGNLFERIHARANTLQIRQSIKLEEKTLSLPPDEKEDVKTRLQNPVVVPLYLHEIRSGEGLALWGGLLEALKQAKADTIHAINFITSTGEQIRVVLSQHKSTFKQSPPDYLVHDKRATLVYHSISGVLQAPAPKPYEEGAFDVSYKAFAGKLEAMRKKLESTRKADVTSTRKADVTEQDIATAALLIVKNPITATAEIKNKLPEVEPDHIAMLYELVGIWMLAEPARHPSAMVSGVAELELIRLGAKTFAAALEDAVTGSHPMAHVGSELQGRRATENLPRLKAKEKRLPAASAVEHKQSEEVTSLGASARARAAAPTPDTDEKLGEAEITRLIDEYLGIVSSAVKSGAPLSATL